MPQDGSSLLAGGRCTRHPLKLAPAPRGVLSLSQATPTHSSPAVADRPMLCESGGHVALPRKCSVWPPERDAPAPTESAPTMPNPEAAGQSLTAWSLGIESTASVDSMFAAPAAQNSHEIKTLRAITASVTVPSHQNN